MVFNIRSLVAAMSPTSRGASLGRTMHSGMGFSASSIRRLASAMASRGSMIREVRKLRRVNQTKTTIIPTRAMILKA